MWLRPSWIREPSQASAARIRTTATGTDTTSGVASATATVSRGANSRRGSGRISGAESSIQFRDLLPSSIVRPSSR
ncbi:hypothetical protein A6F58_13115 [Prescottella equi]|nr:hypothetical protein A6F58_13115 [Prescottella equi]